MICTMFNAEPRTPPSAPSEVMTSLALRLRPSGLGLVFVGADGRIEWQDPDAAAFFRCYAFPSMNIARMAEADGPTASTDPSSARILQAIPGVAMHNGAWTEKGKARGTLILAGRDAGFALTEEVLRRCSQLGVDANWLLQEADRMPGVSASDMERHGRLLMEMFHDLLRLTSFEGELDNLSSQLAATYEELTLIYQVSSGMQITRTACEFFKQTCNQVMDVLGVLGMGIALNAPACCDTTMRLYGRLEMPSETLTRLQRQLLAMLPDREEPLLINDLPARNEFAWLAPYASQLLAVPMKRQSGNLGCIFALNKEEGEFDSTDAKLLISIANESSVYLENSRLFGDVHGLMMGLLHSLTSAVDAKDAYTCGHSERVALLSRELAKRAGLSDNQVERIYMAGLLHDVGKIGVPEAVLRKAGKLTDEEFDEIKKHPEIGVRILQDVKQIADLLPGVMHHHERYDGRGYPTGLAGENIPLMGRIICLADCFDAMTSSRTYRKAMPMETALAEIRRCAGTQFDPVLVEVFLGIPIAQFRKLLHDHHKQCRPLLESSAKSAA